MKMSCTKCKKKLSLALQQTTCRCNKLFCAKHKTPMKRVLSNGHLCSFDHKVYHSKILSESMPKIEDSKIIRL